VTFAALAAFMLWWFLRVFSEDLGSDSNDPATKRAVGEMVYFCYFFIAVSLMSVSLPFAFVILPGDFVSGLYLAMIESPMAVGLGCVYDERPEHRNWEIVCEPNNREPDQWLINVGGDVMALFPPPCAAYGPLQTSTPSPAGGSQPVGSMLTGVTYCFPRIRVHGGLTVPFYFVFVALMGAAVSMTRKIPEYQRQLLDENDPFTPAEARQKMAFQIVQFVSAPLIAITVYVMIMPESSTASVAIAFTSGFSSEVVLKAISNLADRLEFSAPSGPQKSA
jgi:hypothetical protein